MQRFTPYLLVLATVAGTLVLPQVVTVPDTQADEEERPDLATVIVKVPRAKVGDLAAAAHALGGQVYDLESMKPIAAPGVPAGPRIPEIADVTPLVGAVRQAETAARSEDAAFRVDRLDVAQRRLRIRVVSADAETFDRFSTEVVTLSLAGGWMIESLQRGAVQRMTSGTQRANLTFNIAPEPTPRQAAAARLDPMAPVIPNAKLQRVATDVGLQMLSASAVRQEPRGDAGLVLVFRDFTFGPCYADELAAFLDGVAKSGTFVVSEVRLAAADLKQQDDPKRSKLTKPMVRVAALRRTGN